MTAQTTPAAQQTAAKVVGFSYLFVNAMGAFAEVYVRGNLIDYGDPARTAQNIMENEGLFRLGIAGEFVTFIADVVLLVGLYVILAPVSRHLAFLGAALRLVAASVSVMMAAHSLDVLRLLSGGGNLNAIEPAHLQALAGLSISAHDATYLIAFIFLGLGSAVFGYLWLKSRYIPRVLAFWALAASVLLAAGSFVYIVDPGLWSAIDPYYMGPMIIEVVLGFWLLFRSLKLSSVK